MTDKINVAIIGASGYTGVELIRILLTHPNVNIKHLVAESNAGKDFSEVYSHLGVYNLPKLVNFNQVDFEDIDLCFCCLPHTKSQEIVNELPDDMKVIDLSADFRLKNIETYEKWYGNEHLAPQLQHLVAYGLSEIFKDDVKMARIVACPGCYPTGATLPLYPLLEQKIISKNNIIIDAKTGVTGAGRALKQNFLFTEINESAKAYNIGKHRHIPEIEQSLSGAAGSDIKINFTPQIIPMSRGILSTIYVKLNDGFNTESVRKTLRDFYKDESFVNILDDGIFPSTRDVLGTNMCNIAVADGSADGADGFIVLVSVIDNLTKGSSGQAVQNMNIMFDLKDDTGLKYVPVFP